MQDQTVLHNVSLGYSQTMQINSGPMEIIIYFGSKVVICMGDEFD